MGIEPVTRRSCRGRTRSTVPHVVDAADLCPLFSRRRR